MYNPSVAPSPDTHAYLDVNDCQIATLYFGMLEVLGQVDVLDTDQGQCRICPPKHASTGSDDEASGTLGYRSMEVEIVPEHWIRASVSAVRLVDLAGSESAGSSPQSH